MLQNDKRTSCLVVLLFCDRRSMSISESTGKELDPSWNSAAVSEDGLNRAPTSTAEFASGYPQTAAAWAATACWAADGAVPVYLSLSWTKYNLVALCYMVSGDG